MSVRDQINAAKEAGLGVRKEALSVDCVVHDPATETDFAVEARVGGMTERGNSAEGGFEMEHDSQARWERDQNPAPELGWLFRRKDGGRVYRIDEIVDHPNSLEWKIGLGPVGR